MTLVATPADGWAFTSWSGACSGGGDCSVAMTAPITVTATFVEVPKTFELATAVAGTGTGTGTESGSIFGGPALGQLCPGACSNTLLAGTVVTLSAIHGPGVTFEGWLGACSGSSDVCVVTMDAAKSATAIFAPLPPPPPPRVLTTVYDSTLGTVSGGPAVGGMICGGCSRSVPDGTVLTLTATPFTSATFAGWSGPCSGTGSCVVTMNADMMVTAMFLPGGSAYVLTTAIAGTGSGQIFGGPSLGQVCPGVCSNTLIAGRVVTLSAFANPGSIFVGWSGPCSGTSTCVVTMDAAKDVTATFMAGTTYPIATNIAGTGFGNIFAGPAIGVLCNGCTTYFPEGTVLTLSPNTWPGSTFAGWTGACSGTGSCVVTMTAAMSVTANFTQVP